MSEPTEELDMQAQIEKLSEAIKNSGRIVILFPDTENQQAFYQTMSRVRAVMGAYKAFSDGLDNVDEDGPDFEAQFAPVLMRFTKSVTAIYPSQDHFEVDLTSLDTISRYGKE